MCSESLLCVHMCVCLTLLFFSVATEALSFKHVHVGISGRPGKRLNRLGNVVAIFIIMKAAP